MCLARHIFRIIWLEYLSEMRSEKSTIIRNIYYERFLRESWILKFHNKPPRSFHPELIPWFLALVIANIWLLRRLVTFWDEVCLNLSVEFSVDLRKNLSLEFKNLEFSISSLSKERILLYKYLMAKSTSASGDVYVVFPMIRKCILPLMIKKLPYFLSFII